MSSHSSFNLAEPDVLRNGVLLGLQHCPHGRVVGDVVCHDELWLLCYRLATSVAKAEDKVRGLHLSRGCAGVQKVPPGSQGSNRRSPSIVEPTTASAALLAAPLATTSHSGAPLTLPTRRGRARRRGPRPMPRASPSKEGSESLSPRLPDCEHPQDRAQSGECHGAVTARW